MNMKIINKFIYYSNNGFFLLLLILVTACNNEPDIIDISQNDKKKKKKNEDVMVNINKEIVRVEKQFIENYIDRHGLEVKKLKNGIRYDIYKNNPEGSNINEGNRIELKYKMKLLTGNEIKSSDSLLTKSFVVAHSEDIQGLHYAVQYLKEGESAIFIIPSHLAYGITGKKGEIPNSSAIVFDIKSIKITDKNDES